jgi:hypothetical protein
VGDLKGVTKFYVEMGEGDDEIGNCGGRERY